MRVLLAALLFSLGTAACRPDFSQIRAVPAYDPCDELAQAPPSTVEGYTRLATCFMDGQVPPDARPRVVTELLAGAEARHLPSAAVAGLAYAWGDGVPRDTRRAVELINGAAQQGSSIGAEALATLYITGTGVPPSVDQAVVWYRKAAKFGTSSAYEALAVIADKGLRGKRDMERSRKLYRAANDAGPPPPLVTGPDQDPSPRRLFLIGSGLRRGRYPGQTAGEAEAFLKAAAAKGHLLAKALLAPARPSPKARRPKLDERRRSAGDRAPATAPDPAQR